MSALFTDFYEITMARAYRAHSMKGDAVFSLFVRKLPQHRNFMIACGLDDLLQAVDDFRFDDEDIRYLATLGPFEADFLEWAKAFRFSGEIRAVPEGTPVFGNEPIVEIRGPIAEAQLLETLALNIVGFQTSIASKAARIVSAAQGRPITDFGGRRAHGREAAIMGARAAYVAGVTATSNVEAGRAYGIPVAGTMAHSFVQAFPSEIDAFRAISSVVPDIALLVDTYDTMGGVETVIALARERGLDFKIRAIRLDSGDLLALSQQARGRLDAARLEGVAIVASGGMNEWQIDRLLMGGAPIDAFGVGTDMIVSTDAPSLDIAYKLTDYEGRGRLKMSAGKETLPGPKQVFRRFSNGIAVGDTIALATEEGAGPNDAGDPLLRPVMTGGRRTAHLGMEREPISDIRARAQALVDTLPDRLRRLAPADSPYPVAVSADLKRYQGEIRDSILHGR